MRYCVSSSEVKRLNPTLLGQPLSFGDKVLIPVYDDPV